MAKAKTGTPYTGKPKITKPKAAKAKGAQPSRTRVKAGGEAYVEKLRQLIVTSLEDDKAEDIVAIDLRGKSSIADWMIVASGRSGRQVGAIADHLSRKLKDAGARTAIEGKAGGEWVLVDAGDIIVHIFQPETRGFYNIEKMWSVAFPEEGSA